MTVMSYLKWRGNNSKKKKSTNYIREYTWDCSVKRRRATQSQTTQATFTLPEDRNIHEHEDLIFKL